MLLDPNNRLNQRGRPMGLDFVYHPNSRIFNTRNAHRLLRFADEIGGPPLQNKLQEILFRRYFKDGEDLGQLDALASAAAEAAIPKSEFEKYVSSLSSEDEDRRLEQELSRSQQQCNGVPHFIFPSGKEVSGGEAIQVFKKILEAERKS